MQHASKAHLWTKCALSGSVVAGRADGYLPADPDADKDKSDARREGIAAHWLIGEWFAGRLEAGTTSGLVGLVAPNGWVIDAEMVEHCHGYVSYVRDHTGQLLTEHGVVNQHIVGRCDTAIIDPVRREVHVFDFKYGWRLVEVEGNPELLCYGCLLLPEGYTLTLHIYQPRPFHPDGIARASRPMNYQKVTEWRNWLDHQAARAGMPGCEGTPGEHCRDCPARGSCQALAATVYAQYEVVRDSRLAKMTATQLAAELDFLELAEACVKERKAGITAEAEGRISGGEHVAGWELQPKTGNRVFTVGADKVQMMTGIHPFKQVQVSPAELERMGANKTVVKQITTSPSIGRKLARTSTEAFKRMFGKGK
jgi:hypothetical protein